MGGKVVLDERPDTVGIVVYSQLVAIEATEAAQVTELFFLAMLRRCPLHDTKLVELTPAWISTWSSLS